MTDTPPLPAIGTTLRQRRLQKGITAEQVAQDTKIHIKFIRALEEEKWAEFPARVYLEGFMKRYAGYLGLEDEPFVRQYRQISQEAAKPEFSSPAPREEEENAGMTPSGSRPIWFLAAAAGLVLAFALTYIRLEERRLDAQRPAPPAEVLALPPEPAAPPPAPVLREAQVSAKSPVWARVWADDRVRFEGILTPGKPKSWSLEKKLRVMAGNPLLVAVTVDGRPVTPRRGDPAGEIHWSADDVPPTLPADAQKSALPPAAPAPAPKKASAPLPTGSAGKTQPAPSSAPANPDQKP